MLETIAFYTFSALSLSMFLVVVTTNNILYALSSLAAGLIFISAFFFLLNAEFLGVAQIIIYTGAVVALYAFAMMLFDTQKLESQSVKNPKLVFLLSGGIALLLLVIFLAPVASLNMQDLQVASKVMEGVGNVEQIGYVIFVKFLIPFEIAAIMLLVAMIAGIVLAGKEMKHSLTEEEQGEKI
ncbi:NADH-quinone oxidoreductase subunit J [Helicobacter burdigaliensis]|uniref:NADH-quinone oxidoreductase subunit J n=1 Tax=Helicobacter burdigaliensis TaxID=2315334 RepID=UPI000EF6BDEF|nr:NADH-quinone oxidoreductase subunit J [Helicobacter burdigaliensis]